MKFDVLVRHIEVWGPPSPRELVYPRALGFLPQVAGGPDDGGRHLRVLVLTCGRRVKPAWLKASHQRPLEEAWSECKRDHLPSKGAAKKD